MTKAFEEGTYITKTGNVWRRGMDGWFNDSDPNTIHLIRMDEMVDLIREENPE